MHQKKSSEICLKERRTIFQKDEQRKGEARTKCFELLLSLLIDMVFVFNSALGSSEPSSCSKFEHGAMSKRIYPNFEFEQQSLDNSVNYRMFNIKYKCV